MEELDGEGSARENEGRSRIMRSEFPECNARRVSHIYTNCSVMPGSMVRRPQ